MIRNLMVLFSLLISSFSFGLTDSTFNYTDTTFEIGQTRQIPELRVNICGKKTIYKPIIPKNDSIINNIYIFLIDHPQIKVEIIKHSDSRGSISANKLLTQKQANAIKTDLINKGIEPDRIIAIGKGETEPIYTEEACNKYKALDPKKFEQMHATNRRTIIKIVSV